MRFQANARLRESFIDLASLASACPFRATCRAECESMCPCHPQPGFLGRRYGGIVVVGANPGVRYSSGPRDREYMDAIEAFAQEDGGNEDFERLHDVAERYMLTWPRHLGNQTFRRLLGYDIETVAFLNIVKCRTAETGADVYKTAGSNVAQRCFKQHLLPQLDLLRPHTVVFLWKPLATTMTRLGYDLSGVRWAANDGNYRVSNRERAKALRPFFTASDP